MLVITLGVRNQQALHDAADRGFQRPDQEMEVVVQQAIAVKLERPPLLQIGQGGQEGLKIALLAKHVLPVVSPINDVIDQAAVERSQRSWHADNIATAPAPVKINSSDPFFSSPRRRRPAPRNSLNLSGWVEASISVKEQSRVLIKDRVGVKDYWSKTKT